MSHICQIIWRQKDANVHKSASIKIRKGETIVVGNDPNCDIVLADRYVSRKHARIGLGKEGAQVEDLSSTNGTRLDGRPIKREFWKPNQLLEIGGHIFAIQALSDSAQDRRPPAVHPHLRIVWQKQRGAHKEKAKWIEIRIGETFLVGKRTNCNIILDDPLVSREHARIVVDPMGVQVEDLGSTNGTKLGGRPIKREFWGAGQVLEIGSYALVIQALSEKGSVSPDLTTAFLGRPSFDAGDDATPERLRVFISYSRHDMSVADKLTDVLERNGFDVTIDRRDLPYGEEWQRELAEFIRIADTVLFLVSESSVRSKWCAWELDQVLGYRKRLFPLIIEPVPIQRLPGPIRQIQVLPSSGVFEFGRDFRQLMESLNTDRAWVKDHTRLFDRAMDWIERGKPNAMLLRGVALKHAEEWVQKKPRDDNVASEIMDLINRSRRGRLTKRMRWSGISVSAGVLAIFIFFQFDALRDTVFAQAKKLFEFASLVRRLQELQHYRSEFFGRLSGLVKDHRDIRIEGDRFVLQAEVLFPSGQATITPEGFATLDKVAEVIRELEDTIAREAQHINWVLQVDGHTDIRPIASAQFPSNWELSSARATNVVKYLIKRGVSPERLVAAGYGELKPIAHGDSEESLRLNRRIELKLTNR